MSDEPKPKPKGPHEYAIKTEIEKEVRRVQPKRTRFLFKFLGLILVGLAALWLWYSYKQGKLIDPTDEKQQRATFDQASADAQRAAQKTKEASVDALAWAQRSLGDLQKLIKGKPPETKEEVKALVDESKQAAAKEPAKPAASAPAIAPPPSPIADAQAEYRTGQDFYIKTDPMASQQQVQSNLHLAEPHFSKCLDLLETARTRGVNGPEIDRLEQAAARRLYDCRKRMELQRN
jgi:hypothetical protein